MKAAVFEEIGRIAVRDVPDPDCPPGWVVLKVVSAGVCATDVHIVSGAFKHGDPPAILGHEICGTVARQGAGAKRFAIGERVVVETGVGCGKCAYCQSGNKHLCPSGGEIGFPPYAGGYAQYVAVPESCLHRVPDAVRSDEAGILEAVACPYGALMRLKMGAGEHVLVLGGGIAALAFVQAAAMHAPRSLIVAARRVERVQLACSMGATALVDLNDEGFAESIRELTGGGATLVIDAVGVPQTIDTAVRCAAPMGRIVLYGIPDSPVALPVTDIILRQLTLFGLTNNERAWAPLLRDCANGHMNLSALVTHRFPLSRIEEAFDLVARRPTGLIKAVIHPWEEEIL